MSFTVGDLNLIPRNTGGVVAPRTRPTVVPGLVLDPLFSSLPDILWKLIGTAGWVTHVPLTYFLDEFINSTSEHAKLDEVVHMGSGGKWIRSGGEQLPDRGELTMEPLQWILAWQRFIGVLNSLAHPDVARWHSHVQLIMKQNTFGTEFLLWLMYDIKIRRRSLREGVDPSILQTEILAALRPEYERTRSNSYIQAELARRLTPVDLGCTRNTTLALSSTLSGGQAATSTLPQARSADRTRGAQNRCFLCGATNHLAFVCTATAMAAGGKMTVSRESPTSEWTLAGKPFCYKFNGIKGCTLKGCKNPHICSLCGSASHGAQNCRK